MAPGKGAKVEDSPERNLVTENLIRTARNQVIIRGTKAVGGMLIASGMTALSNKPLTRVSRRTVSAKTNPKGKVVVREHRQTTIERTTTERGRNFLSQQQRKRPAARAARRIFLGRALPVIAYGWIGYDLFTRNKPVNQVVQETLFWQELRPLPNGAIKNRLLIPKLTFNLEGSLLSDFIFWS